MKILVLTHEYPPVGGGGGRVAQDISRGLAQRGHQVRVLTALCGQLSAHEEQDGVEILRLKSFRREMFRADMRAMAGFVFSALREGLRQAREWQPDIVHAHFAVPAGLPALLLKRFTGTPYALTAHLGDVPGGVPEKTGKWFRWIFPFTPPIWQEASAIAAVSAYTRDLALKRYPVHIEVILNGVDLNALNPGEIKAGQPPRVVFAGRFQPQKNPLALVRCLAGVRDLPWTCSLLGDGPLRPQVEAEIERLGVGDRFRLEGWVTPEQVIERFRSSDLLFMPSLSEGLPVVGVHAVAMGLALVMSRVGGCVDLVAEGQNGYLLEADDMAGFERALRDLLGNHQRLQAFRRASRAHAANFDLQKIIGQYESLLNDAAHK
jgi:glycosyltransferase involved in cell wall biosynthesis